MKPDTRVEVVPPALVTTAEAAGASLLIPGLGQFLQRRYVTGALHAASVSAYAFSALKFGGRGWMLGALLFNLWSVVDAIWWSRGSGSGSDHDAR